MEPDPPAILLGVDAVLSVPLLVGVTCVAIVSLVLLKKTRLFWLPGTALIGYGIAIYVAWPWYDTTQSDVGGMSGLGGLSNLLHVAATLVVVGLGTVCLIVGAASYRRASRARRTETELPTAIVMKERS